MIMMIWKQKYVTKSIMNLIEYLNKVSKFDKDYYFSLNKINHSKLVNFEKYGPKGLVELPKQTKAMNFGSLVDCLLFTPERFDSEFYICDSDNVLTDKQLELFDILFSNSYNGLPVYKLKVSDETNQFILSLCRANKIYSSFKDSTVIQKVTSLYDAFDRYEENRSKISITADEYNQAVKVVNALKTSELSSKIFTNFKVFYQVAIVTDDTKVLFDMILLDMDSHTIIPIDLKVTQSSEMEWVENSFYRFKYFRQAEMYWDALKKLMSEVSDGRDWIIDDFKFLVVSAQDPAPLLFNFPLTYNESGDLIISKKGSSVVTYDKIVKMIKWHLENNEYDYPEDIIMDLYSNKNTNKLTYINIID